MSQVLSNNMRSPSITRFTFVYNYNNNNYNIDPEARDPAPNSASTCRGILPYPVKESTGAISPTNWAQSHSLAYLNSGPKNPKNFEKKKRKKKKRGGSYQVGQSSSTSSTRERHVEILTFFLYEKSLLYDKNKNNLFLNTPPP